MANEGAPMKISGTPDPRADDEQLIDITTTFDVTYFSTLLHITPECLRDAVIAAGPKLGDVRRFLEGPGAESREERSSLSRLHGPLLPRSLFRRGFATK